MQTDSHTLTIVASIFTAFVFTVGIAGFGGDLADYLMTSTEPAHEAQYKSQLGITNITQIASAQADCSGSYGKSLGDPDTCYRSGSTTYTVVLATSTSPTSTMNAIDDPTPTTDYQVESGGGFQADGATGNPDGVLANDLPAPGKSNLTVQSWDDSGLLADTFNTTTSGEFQYAAPTVSTTTTTHFNYTATNGSSTDTATGTITITPPANTCPKPDDVQDDNYSMDAGGELVVDTSGATPDPVLANDNDPDGDDLDAVIAPGGPSPAGAGSLSFDEDDGTFTYDSNGSYVGDVTFDYQAQDSEDCGAEATVTISINSLPPVAGIDGPDSINYCETDGSQLEYDGGRPHSYDQDDGGDDIVSWIWGLVSAPTSTSITSTTGPTTRFSSPVTWTGTSTLGLDVEDDEGDTDTGPGTTTQVTVNVPDYVIDEDNIEPSDRRIWITASSTKRSTKATIPVKDFTDSNFDYDFDDIYLTFSEAGGIATSSMEWKRATSSNAFKFWVHPESEADELAFGTYDITVNATLDIGGGSCVYSEPAAKIDLRAQTTAEF
jgi:hypothetical protein